MTVGVTIEGGTLAQYDQATGEMGFTAGGSGAPGLLFHWAAATDTGLHIVDAWQTKEHFQRFADEKIGPVTQEFGLPAPSITFHEVHNYLTAGPA